MLHSYTRIFVHLIWGTKNRQKFLTKPLRPSIEGHFITYARDNQIMVDTLGVQPEHVHLLLMLRSNQTVENVVKLLKGESSHWINSENLIRPKFSWQRGYGAFSVSPSKVDQVRAYIKNQDEHHRIKSFSEEYGGFLRSVGFTQAETDESVSK